MRGKTIVSVFLITLLCLIAAGCSRSPAYVGTWYDITDPDQSLTITEDGQFATTGYGGTVVETENGCNLVSDYYGSEEIIVTTYDDLEALYCTNYDDYYIKDYDTACEIRDRLVEEAIDSDNAAAEESANAIINYCIGTWSGSGPDHEPHVTFHDDFTYDAVDMETGEKSSGEWEFSQGERGYYCYTFKVTYDDGEWHKISKDIDLFKVNVDDPSISLYWGKVNWAAIQIYKE